MVCCPLFFIITPIFIFFCVRQLSLWNARQMSGHDNSFLWPLSTMKSSMTLEHTVRGSWKPLTRKKQTHRFYSQLAAFPNTIPKNLCPYHAIILAKRPEIDDTCLNTSREVHAYLIGRAFRTQGHGHGTIRPHSL